MNMKNGSKQPKKLALPPGPSEPATQSVKAKEDDEILSEALIESACTVTGTKTFEIADQLVSGLAWLFLPSGGKELTEKSKDKALARAIWSFQEMEPANYTEAMLAAQMISINRSAQRFMELAFAGGQSSEVIDGHINRAVRLQRLFTEQVETWQRLRGKSGQQRVVVEHVHVHDGGQASVGAVSGRPRNRRGQRDQSRPPSALRRARRSR